MRFVFVDRILDLVAGKSIETIKNVSASEDYFADHFPGMPIMPGALVLECFIQSAMLMFGAVDRFGTQPMVKRIRSASFRHFVRPGDRMTVRCEADEEWVVRARATVDDRSVATAVIEFERGAPLQAENPLRALYDTVRADPHDLLTRVGEG